jgi:ribosomal protein S18 acetylase RimI-like enzyme
MSGSDPDKKFVVLDVYQNNQRAIELYKRFEFEIVGDDFDEKEQQPYFIMARNVSVSCSSPLPTPPQTPP